MPLPLAGFSQKKLDMALAQEGKGCHLDRYGDNLETWVFLNSDDPRMTPCLGCGSEGKCCYYDHKRVIWEAVDFYLRDRGLEEKAEEKKVRRQFSSMRKAAYAAFHRSYHGPGGGRIQLPDCVEFRIKYWLDSESYMGFCEE